jgi:hypothetical protein
MAKRELMFLLPFAFILLIFMACEKSWEPELYDNEQDGNNQDNEDTGDANVKIIDYTVEDVLAGNKVDHDNAGDYIWESTEVVHIELNEYSITTDKAGAVVNGNKVTITSAGTYSIRGALADGQIIVDTDDKKIVRLILNGVNISSSVDAPINVINAEKAIIIVAENTENYITDAESYIFENPEDDEPNAAIFSKSDLTICGKGALTVDGNFNDGIASKDGLIIASGNINVNAVDDGIRGKDYLVVRNGKITVNALGDGMKSDNDEDSTRGYIIIEEGVININSGGDAITAKTDVLIAGGEISLSSGGGSNSSIAESTSAKGIKAAVIVVIDGGTNTINSADDAIHSNGYLVINGGSFIISTGDDGIHADSSLGINGGEISITKCYEGIESLNVISITNGDIHIISNDDGLNVVGDGDIMGGRPGQGNFVVSSDYYLYISGGSIVVNAVGDGIDINGSVVMTDGDLIINGPTSNMNSALDFNATFKINGGFLLAAGSSGMAQIPGTASTQYSVLLNFNSLQQAGDLVHIQTSEGQEVLTFKPSKNYQSIGFSSPELKKGTTYDVYLGGSSTGTANDGIYDYGTYSPGIKYTSFTISGIVTKITR